jgi:hypothetical protein
MDPAARPMGSWRCLPTKGAFVTMAPEELREIIARTVEQVLFRHPAELPIPFETADLRPFDYARMAMVTAAVDAARFLERNFRSAQNLVNREDLLRHACRMIRLDGAVLEFGVLGGESLRILSAELGAHSVHGFDSFEGLPADWKYDTPAGSFSNSGAVPPDLPDGVVLHVGDFTETIESYRRQHTDQLAFLHVDCDLYESARTVLFGLADRMRPGTVVVFDEFLNYPSWQDHEYRAFTEFVAAFGVTFEYIAFASSYQSVALRITGPPAAA